ncbi:hypothetical protein F5Y17DRAFT_298834 [Xylariaceae sp. FL0594]|nr:hypothetical protein F5Y17DRAFT_298834 [Xylariaceae sp. FL0594]
MVAIMDRWGQEHYAPRQTDYYSRGGNPEEIWDGYREGGRQVGEQALRLPPPSTLVSNAPDSQGGADRRAHPYHNSPGAPGPYWHPAAMSVQHAASAPTPAFTPHEHSNPPVPIVDIHRTRQPLDAQQPLMGRNLSQGSSTAHHPWPTSPEARPVERMRIADLLSNDQVAMRGELRSSGPRMVSQTASQKASEIPSGYVHRGARSSVSNQTYRIHIRQQPVAARSCGYGERDRRVIDPPPIVEMTIDDPTATEEEIRERLSHSFSVMHCTIRNEAGDEDMSSMPEDYRTQRRLMGTVVSSPFVGRDENDEYGCFFCFPDLSCRTPGAYRLQFTFMVLDPASKPGCRTPVTAVILSDAFNVYNAKDFPGMQASTPLTRRLKEQGCLISVKKGKDRSDPIRKRYTSDSNDEDADEDDDNLNYNGANGQKRPRHAKP